MPRVYMCARLFEVELGRQQDDDDDALSLLYSSAAGPARPLKACVIPFAAESQDSFSFPFPSFVVRSLLTEKGKREREGSKSP